MYLAVKDVKPIENYKLIITFDNEIVKLFDMKPFLEKGIFKELKDETLFKTVKVSFDSIEWSNGADVDPETLYEDSIPYNPQDLSWYNLLVRKKLENIFKKYKEIKKVILFGSRARKDNKYNSDIDLCLLVEKITHLIHAKVTMDIEEINTPLSFDILNFNELTKEKLIENIKNEGIVIYNGQKVRWKKKTSTL